MVRARQIEHPATGSTQKKMPREAEPQKDIADRLMAALQQDEFVLYSQVISALGPHADDRPFHEVFVRFKEEDAKLLPPGTFFPVLEEVGMLPYLDRWVVNRLARHVRSGLKIKPTWNVPRYIVNLSDGTLADPQFGSYVLQYVADSYLSGGVLGFDISCDSAKANRKAMMHLMDQLRPHFVKISAVGVDPGKVPDINRMCHALDAQTIAEHIENAKVLEHLRRCKIDYGQGFLIAKVEPL
jgi:EAL domain-containing protein (putative c-di-GMP-specific phosphodiesterase class I)